MSFGSFLPQHKSQMPPAPMDPQKFKSLTENLLKYNKKTDRYDLISLHKACEDCNAIVKDRKVYCEAYNLNGENPYFRHRCRNCKAILFDGSFKRAHNKYPILAIKSKRQK